MLYLVATPIGNLQDISYRAIETLKSSDYILCEDTRHSQILLKHYDIQKILLSFHKFNEYSKEDSIIEDLKNGKIVSLISDAGTPGISDPGAKLVARCTVENINIISIPGPCAVITAISASGLNTDMFQFVGFLPKKPAELKKTLYEIFKYPSTTVAYESPERIDKVLKLIHTLDPGRKIVIARELTKKFEEFLRGTAKEILSLKSGIKIKGEIVLMFDGKVQLKQDDWSHLTIHQHVEHIQTNENISLKDAIKRVANIRSVPKKIIYNTIHE